MDRRSKICYGYAVSAVKRKKKKRKKKTTAATTTRLTAATAKGNVWVKRRFSQEGGRMVNVRIPDHVDILADMWCGAQVRQSYGCSLIPATASHANIFRIIRSHWQAKLICCVLWKRWNSCAWWASFICLGFFPSQRYLTAQQILRRRNFCLAHAENSHAQWKKSQLRRSIHANGK